MTVKIYISKDSANREWPPDHFHEGDAVIRILQDLWVRFNHLPDLFIAMANLHQPNADMLILTERGLGIIELKHYPGVVSIAEDGWFADGKPIKAGAHYTNPHRQVQAYAAQVRESVLQFILPIYLARNRNRWDELHFQTTVCFTHPNANIEAVKNAPVKCLPWERPFTITAPTDIPSWVSNLRFEVCAKEHSYDPHCLPPETLINLATLRLKGTEWDQALQLMPTGEPYAYLVLKEGNQTFALHQEVSTIGRDSDNDIPIPSTLLRVSRRHAQIKREIGQVIIEDLGSKHGTFVDGKPISKPTPLKHGQSILLGKGGGEGRACTLEFLLRTRAVSQPERTKSSTSDKQLSN